MGSFRKAWMFFGGSEEDALLEARKMLLRVPHPKPLNPKPHMKSSWSWSGAPAASRAPPPQTRSPTFQKTQKKKGFRGTLFVTRVIDFFFLGGGGG